MRFPVPHGSMANSSSDAEPLCRDHFTNQNERMTMAHANQIDPGERFEFGRNCSRRKRIAVSEEYNGLTWVGFVVEMSHA